MSGLRFASFGAATMPLSKIVVDGDLNLIPYDVDAHKVKATIYDMPPLQTEMVSLSPTTTLSQTQVFYQVFTPTNPIEIYNNTSGHLQRLTFLALCGSDATLTFVTGGDTYIRTILAGVWTTDLDPIDVEPGNNITLQCPKYIDFRAYRTLPLYTYDLSGIWLSVNTNIPQDSSGVLTFPEFGGVPFGDYMYFFPLIPSGLAITGDFWFEPPTLTKYAVVL